jgi:hypothetical protein
LDSEDEYNKKRSRVSKRNVIPYKPMNISSVCADAPGYHNQH